MRFVGFLIVLLLVCLCFPFTHANPYRLDGDKTDACFEPSQKGTAECLQELIESYYGPSFTKYCPEFPQILAKSRCTGCPWDRLDPEKINPAIAQEYRAASNQTELFHEPAANCSVSNYATRFADYQLVMGYVSLMPFFGSLPVLFSTGAIVQYTSGYDGSTRPSFCGRKVYEWLFIGAVWIWFNIGKVLLAVSEQYYFYCDSAASNVALVITRYLSYVLLIYYSLRRCRLLRFPQTEGSHSLISSNDAQSNRDSSKSWKTFIWHKEKEPRRKFIRIRKAIGFLQAYGSPFVILFLFFVELFGGRFFSSTDGRGYMCTVSVVNTSARAVAISKLALEPFVYIVYCIGGSTRNKVAYYVRYVVLASIVVLCVCIVFLMNSSGLYVPTATSFLFGAVPLETLGLAELTHVFAISMLGLLEPLRYGSIYPGRG